MKKGFRKISSIVLAIATMLAMSTTAFAAGNTGSSDYNGSTGHPYAQQDDETFSIKKEIVLFNVDNSDILDPNIVYTYQVTPVDVTDGDPTVTGYVLNDNTKTTTAVVKDGIANAVTIQGRKVNDSTTVTGTAGATTTLTFGGDNTTKKTTLDEGAAVAANTTAVTTGYIDVTIDPSVIYAANKGPGIYRYLISDITDEATFVASGVTRSDSYVKNLYLDVYLENNDANNDGTVDGYKVYGYVLFKGNADLDLELDASLTSEANKVDGYTVLSEVALADQYHTFNLEVDKTTTGDLADKRNNFPFEVNLTNGNVTSLDDFYYVVTKDGTAQTEVITNLSNTGAKTIGSASTTAADNLELQDGDKIVITGLPVGTSADVTEYNNTSDLYTASAKDEANATLKLDNNSTTATTNADTVPLEKGKTASLTTIKAIDNTDAKDVVAFTNTIDTISPTGFVTRFAPYALVLIGGILLITLAAVLYNRTNKKEA